MIKKKLLSCVMLGSLCLALCIPGTAYADGQKVVTLGADLTNDQKTAVLKYFGIAGQNIQTLTITNQDERNHLGSYVPLEQIGTKTFSCALVCPTTSGGIQVKTANLSWVTSNMIATTLSTSGVVNCDVLAASPFEVSGTGALTGIIMAYESASGTTLDPVKKELATQELIATGTIANEVGQQQATNIVNEIKIQVIQGQVMEPEQVEEIVDDVVDDNSEIVLSDEDKALLTGLMTQIAEQQYNYDEMKDTLQRVESNVGDINSKIDELQTTEAAAETEASTEAATEAPLDPDSILMNTDDSALGEDTNIDATNQDAVQTEAPSAEAETQAPDGFEITTSDTYSDPNAAEAQIPEETTASTEYTDGQIDIPETTENMDGQIDIPETTENMDGQTDTSATDNPTVDIMGGETAEPENTDITEAPVEPAVDAAEAFVLGQIIGKPDSTYGTLAYAGLSQIKVLFSDTNIVPVSGTLKITDAFGTECCSVDLADATQIKVSPISDSDMMEQGWSSGTELLVNTNYILQPSQNYTVTIDGMAAQSADGTPEGAQGAASASFSTSWAVNTDAYGVGLNIPAIAAVSATGSPLAGTVYFQTETTGIASASVSNYDASMVSFDVTDFSGETGTSFNLTCLQSGKTSFSVDFYDIDGNYISTVVYELEIQ
ncbi:MAG: DUF1002 domain-containing protein [Lachnospiraceae bacterium]|nr:DUF1002 domain-containing protein [Lachnospiraceae bacterium]